MAKSRKSTGKSHYNEKTKLVNFKCPISKIDDFKVRAYEILDGYIVVKSTETK